MIGWVCGIVVMCVVFVVIVIGVEVVNLVGGVVGVGLVQVFG